MEKITLYPKEASMRGSIKFFAVQSLIVSAQNVHLW
jgi:hypothetical protein